jgi:hypothetical protein
MSKTFPVRLADSTVLSRPALILPDRQAERVRIHTHDNYMTFDQLTVDSAGSFLIGELERLDPTLHDPLVSITWPRDIDLREDVTIADETSSFTNSSFSAPGGVVPAGINWISKDANAIAGIALDIGKTAKPLYLWGMEVKWTLPELASAQKLGRPVDVQKYDGMKLKHQMDTDAVVYTGDSTIGTVGLCNNDAVVVPTNVAPGSSGSTLWANKNPDEILADINAAETAVWAASGYALVPSELRLPPTAFSYLVSQKVSNAGNVSILEFVKANSLCNASNGRPLNIQPLKWLTGLGVSGANRMFIYTRDKDRVRFPMVPLQRTQIEARSIFMITTYYGRLGVVEFVYPETCGSFDGV